MLCIWLHAFKLHNSNQYRVVYHSYVATYVNISNWFKLCNYSFYCDPYFFFKFEILYTLYLMIRDGATSQVGQVLPDQFIASL